MNIEKGTPSQISQNPERGQSPEQIFYRGAELVRLFREDENGRRPIDALPTAFAILNLHGAVVAANERTRELFGNPEALESGEFYLVTPDDREHIEELLRGERDHHASNLDYKSLGKYIKVRVTAPEVDENNHVIFAEVDDVTAEVEQIRAQAEELQNIKAKVNNLIHDIGNKAAIALGYSATFFRGFKQTDPLATRAVDSIKSFIEWYKDEVRPAGRDILIHREKRSLNMNEVLRAAVQEHFEQIKNQKINVIEDLGENVPQITGDPYWTYAISKNLVGNALKHGFKPDPERRIDNPTITIRSKAERGFITISVSDNGHGIPEDIRSEVYKPDFTTHEEGTGQGLHIVSTRVGLSGWTINFESHTQEEVNEARNRPRAQYLQRGTTFTVRIPLEVPQQK